MINIGFRLIVEKKKENRKRSPSPRNVAYSHRISRQRRIVKENINKMDNST